MRVHCEVETAVVVEPLTRLKMRILAELRQMPDAGAAGRALKYSRAIFGNGPRPLSPVIAGIPATAQLSTTGTTQEVAAGVSVDQPQAGTGRTGVGYLVKVRTPRERLLLGKKTRAIGGHDRREVRRGASKAESRRGSLRSSAPTD